MSRVEIDSLPDTAKTWLFGISPSLDETQSRQLLQQVDQFLDEWAAHGTSVTSARALLENSFLAIAVDERSETSGCSIDRMFGLLRHFENDLGVSILDANRVFVRHADGRVEALSRTDFRPPAGGPLGRAQPPRLPPPRRPAHDRLRHHRRTPRRHPQRPLDPPGPGR